MNLQTDSLALLKLVAQTVMHAVMMQKAKNVIQTRNFNITEEVLYKSVGTLTIMISVNISIMTLQY